MYLEEYNTPPRLHHALPPNRTGVPPRQDGGTPPPPRAGHRITLLAGLFC